MQKQKDDINKKRIKVKLIEKNIEKAQEDKKKIRGAIEKIKTISQDVPINLAFEGGEAETFVLDGPIFQKRIKILKADIDWHFDNGTYIITDAILVDKN